MIFVTGMVSKRRTDRKGNRINSIRVTLVSNSRNEENKSRKVVESTSTFSHPLIDAHRWSFSFKDHSNAFDYHSDEENVDEMNCSFWEWFHYHLFHLMYVENVEHHENPLVSFRTLHVVSIMFVRWLNLGQFCAVEREMRILVESKVTIPI